MNVRDVDTIVHDINKNSTVLGMAASLYCGVNTWLKILDECRKGEHGSKMNQERDSAGRAENGRNLGRAIPQTHLFLRKADGDHV